MWKDAESQVGESAFVLIVRQRGFHALQFDWRKGTLLCVLSDEILQLFDLHGGQGRIIGVDFNLLVQKNESRGNGGDFFSLLKFFPEKFFQLCLSVD